MSGLAQPDGLSIRSLLGEVVDLPIPRLVAPGSDVEAAQAAGAWAAPVVMALLGVAPPSAHGAGPGAGAIGRQVRAESVAPEAWASEGYAPFRAFLGALEDELASQAIQVDGLGASGVLLLRAPDASPAGAVVALQLPPAWVATPLPNPGGGSDPFVLHRTAEGIQVALARISPERWFSAFNLERGEHVSLTRQTHGGLRAVTGFVRPSKLLDTPAAWDVEQPEWVESLRASARKGGGWWECADALGVRLRAGNEANRPGLLGILERHRTLRSAAGEALPGVAAAAIGLRATEKAAEMVRRSQRLLPSEDALADEVAVVELDPVFWEGDRYSAAGEAELAALLLERDRLESVRSLLSLVDAESVLDETLAVVDEWLRRAMARSRRIDLPAAAAVRLHAVASADPHAWWASV